MRVVLGSMKYGEDITFEDFLDKLLATSRAALQPGYKP